MVKDENRARVNAALLRKLRQSLKDLGDLDNSEIMDYVAADWLRHNAQEDIKTSAQNDISKGCKLNPILLRDSPNVYFDNLNKLGQKPEGVEV